MTMFKKRPPIAPDSQLLSVVEEAKAAVDSLLKVIAQEECSVSIQATGSANAVRRRRRG